MATDFLELCYRVDRQLEHPPYGFPSAKKGFPTGVCVLSAAHAHTQCSFTMVSPRVCSVPWVCLIDACLLFYDHGPLHGCALCPRCDFSMPRSHKSALVLGLLRSAHLLLVSFLSPDLLGPPCPYALLILSHSQAPCWFLDLVMVKSQSVLLFWCGNA